MRQRTTGPVSVPAGGSPYTSRWRSRYAALHASLVDVPCSAKKNQSPGETYLATHRSVSGSKSARLRLAFVWAHTRNKGESERPKKELGLGAGCGRRITS